VLWLAVPALAAAGARSLAVAAPEVRRIEITASRYRFDPARVEVRQGEVVELVLRSLDTDHGMAIKAYAVKVAIPKGGEAVGVSFVATRPGTFPFECSEYCGSGHRRMKGELVVESAR
jgi:cytochrome c oxidase subunit 2